MAKKGKKVANAIKRWDKYFGEDTLENWQRLVADLDISGSYATKTQCRKAIKKVWVNIFDFLEAMDQGTVVRKFPNQRALATYTINTSRIFPRNRIPRGSPMGALLAEIL